MKNWQPLVLGPEFCNAHPSLAIHPTHHPSPRQPNDKKGKEKEKSETYRHTQHPSLIMPQLQPRLLIRKLPRPIHRRAARSIAINEIPSLHHEIADNAVEAAVLVALRPAQVVFRLARAELAEVLGGAGHLVGVEQHFDAAEGLAAQGDVEEDGGVFGGHFSLVFSVGGLLMVVREEWGFL